MKPVHFLSTDELSAVSHPVRQRMLGLLAERGELSGREMAELLPDAPSNPYYHLDLLRRAGLVEVVRSERRRGAMEKYYATVARTFSLDPGELAGSAGAEGGRVRAGIMAVARNGAEAALDDLAGALERGRLDGTAEPSEDDGTSGSDESSRRTDPFVNLCTLRLTPARAEELRARMKTWLEDALAAGGMTDVGRTGGDDDEDDDEEDDECEEYVFYQLFFPRAPS